jgi:threonine aldolase
MIDLRSDTLTQPSAGMRRAMAEAVVGDEQKREDPTVIALEERAAELLGQEEAVYLPTATMANQIALRVLTEPGDEVVAEGLAHVFRYELGGPAVHSGLAMKSLATENGIFTAEQVRDAISPPGDLHTAPTRVVCVENTHNGGGGRVWSIDHVRAVVAEARRHGLHVHLDGARLMNAAVASGTPAAEYGREFDTVTLCLSKGLGCPLGALVAGSRERMAKARRMKHLFGGAMRQAGIVAAAGLYALEHNVERLAEDHANARAIGERLHGCDHVELGLPETNIVVFGLRAGAPDAATVVARAAERDVLVMAFGPRTVRAVTHLDVARADCERAADVLAEAVA